MKKYASQFWPGFGCFHVLKIKLEHFHLNAAFDTKINLNIEFLEMVYYQVLHMGGISLSGYLIKGRGY